MEFTFESHSSQSTTELGILFGKVLKSPLVVALSGELGSGKTHFTRAVAEGLGVISMDAVCSPTYTIVNEYPFQSVKNKKGVLYHADFYRLKTADDLDDIGFSDFAFGKNICLIEWAERFPQVLHATQVEIRFAATSENDRLVQFIFKSLESFDSKKFVSEATSLGAKADNKRT